MASTTPLPNVLYPTLSNANHASPNMMYIWDNGILNSGAGHAGTTGAWRPASPGDYSSNVNITGGTVNIDVDSVAVTGGNIAISNTPGVIVQNAVLPVSGVVAFSNTSINTSSTLVGGFAGITGVVQVTDGQYATVNNSTLSGSNSTITTGQALANNAARNQFYIQVVGTGSPLFIAYGNAAASQTNFNVLLKADSSVYGGNGGVLADESYTGPVYVSGGVGCLFTVWQG